MIDWIILGPMLAKILADFLSAERSRSGLTDEEIFERAGVKLDNNEAKLVADLVRLQGAPAPPAELLAVDPPDHQGGGGGPHG